MHFKVYDVFYSQSSHQHVSASLASVYSVVLLQEHKDTNVDTCVHKNSKLL